MGASWSQFYEDRLLDPGYVAYAREKYLPFIRTIQSHIKEGDRIVEVGCGLATITRILAQMKDEKLLKFCGFRCYDACPEMVGLASLNLAQWGFPVEVGDARRPTGRYPDVVHSHGVLEHMPDEDIEKVIRAAREDGTRVSVHYVPGDKYDAPSFGDERLLPLDYWVERFKPTRASDFNDGYDYCLEWVH